MFVGFEKKPYIFKAVLFFCFFW